MGLQGLLPRCYRAILSLVHQSFCGFVEVAMAGKPGSVSELPTLLPARYDKDFAWKLHRRCKVARQVAADLYDLWQALGGFESLSPQQRWLCERVVYLRRRCLAYESAVLAEIPPPMDAGTYSNHANVLQGYLRTLGLERRQKSVAPLSHFNRGASVA